jgi:hypothetical protein
MESMEMQTVITELTSSLLAWHGNALKTTLGCVVAMKIIMGEWKYACMDCGAQCVMIGGIQEKLLLTADNFTFMDLHIR